MTRDTVNGSFGGTIHVAQRDMSRPIFDEFLPKCLTGNNNSLEARVFGDWNDSEDRRCLVQNADAKSMEGPWDVTKYEILHRG